MFPGRHLAVNACCRKQPLATVKGSVMVQPIADQTSELEPPARFPPRPERQARASALLIEHEGYSFRAYVVFDTAPTVVAANSARRVLVIGHPYVLARALRPLSAFPPTTLPSLPFVAGPRCRPGRVHPGGRYRNRSASRRSQSFRPTSCRPDRSRESPRRPPPLPWRLLRARRRLRDGYA